MPQVELLEGHRILMRQLRVAKPVKGISRSLRPYLSTLYSAKYVNLAFDWRAFETMASLTVEGEARLAVDAASHLSPL